MDNHKLLNRIEQQLREAKEIDLSLRDLLTAVSEQPDDRFCSLAADAALRCERFTCRMRHLLYAHTDLRKTDYLISAGESQGMILREYPEMFEVVLPCLLPGKKRKDGSEFLTDPLYALLSRYAENHPIRRYEHAVICFVHEYDRTLPERRVMDYDNWEQKQILDVLATFFLRDDGGLYCDTYHTTLLGEADRTRIFILSEEQFPIWYLRKNEL